MAKPKKAGVKAGPHRTAAGGQSASRRRGAAPVQAKAPSPNAGAMHRAAELAARIPLVHFPANDDFENWADGSRKWLALQSKASRGGATPSTPFGQLRGEHVFAYAGPSCYFRHGCIGNSLLYFDPEATRGKRGGALPFDSGSLEDTPPRLQPWKSRGASPDDCWKVVERHRKDLPGFRTHLEDWLVASYDSPDRYLESGPDRHAAGEPDRLDPPEILEHNGTKGRARYGGDCADRRAWTWEIHVAGELDWSSVRAVHVPFSLLRQATAWARLVESIHGRRPEIRTLPPGDVADYDSLYAASGEALREMVR